MHRLIMLARSLRDLQLLSAAIATCVRVRSGVSAIALLGAVLTGCAFTTTAKDWSGLNGPNNQPTYYVTTMKVGVKLLIVIPFLGDMGISGLTRDLTNSIKQVGGNEVRILQGTEEAYFYGFPPFTWIVTPVISTVAAEYAPKPDVYASDQAVIEQTHKETWWNRWYKPWSW